MSIALDNRPLVLAVVLTALALAAWTLTDAGVRSPEFSFGGDDSVAATPADAAGSDVVPEYLGYLTACETTSGLPRCPDTLPAPAPLIGLVSPGFAADGRVQPGAVDRYHLQVHDGLVTAALDGDRGAALGVYAAGQALLDPAAGRTAVDGLAVPGGVTTVQLVVVNDTDAPREYRLSVD